MFRTVGILFITAVTLSLAACESDPVPINATKPMDVATPTSVSHAPYTSPLK
jgi:starvation-inducible outer membrane lipoprotein